MSPVDTRQLSVAFLGRMGSFSSIVARERYANARLVSQASVPDIVDFVRAGDNRLGIVPIENTSGGIIHDTIDVLVDDSFDLFILEETIIHVRLALLGRKNESIQTIYSHWVPLKHCREWIKTNFPGVRTQATNSTSEAAMVASQDAHAAAIATRESAKEYGLDLLEYPILESVPNRTHFFTLGREPGKEKGNTCLVVTISNLAGSLFELLKPFHDHGVNLSRIQSKNIPGTRDACKFFIELEGTIEKENVQRAFADAKKIATEVKSLGSFPLIQESYQS